MKHSKLILAVLLVFTLGSTTLAGQAKKDQKRVVGSTGIGGGDSDTKKPQTPGQKNPKVKGQVGISVEDDEERPVIIQPPPPSVARLVLNTNVPGATVLVNNKPYKANSQGDVAKPIDLKASQAKIIVKHDDFHEMTEVVPLRLGEIKPIELELISKYGTIIFDGLPEKALIAIDDKEQPGEREMTAEKGAGIDKDIKVEKASFARIPTGQHKFKIVHPDYLDWEGTLDVKPGTPTENFLASPLKLAVAKLTVNALEGTIDSLAGAKVYVDGEEKGEVPPDGKLEIDNIRFKKADKYDIRVVKNGFLEWLPKDKAGKPEKVALAIGPNSIDVKLLPIPNSAQFSEYFKAGLSKWRADNDVEAPKEWKAEGGWLTVQGTPVLGFPKDTVYRNFDAVFRIKLVNGKGLAWAVRVQGAKYGDYYMFYLNGPNGKNPSEFRTYVVKDGKVDLSKPIIAPTDCVLKLTSNDIYTIRVEARGNKIDTFIQQETGDNAKILGKEFPLGTFTDENPRFYTYGDVGFRTIDGEVAMIKDLFIAPFETPEEKKAASK